MVSVRNDGGGEERERREEREEGRGGERRGDVQVTSPRGSRFAPQISSYLCLSAGLMYQSKPSLRPASSSSGRPEEETRSKEGLRPVSARVAATRCALDSGTSQSGSVLGTSAYSWGGGHQAVSWGVEMMVAEWEWV